MLEVSSLQGCCEVARIEHGDRIGHGDRKGRHYYATSFARFTCIVVATLAVAMLRDALGACIPDLATALKFIIENCAKA